MNVSVSITHASDFLTIVLDAIELPDLKLECEFACEPKVATSIGEAYATGLLRFLCLDGMRVSRRPLSLVNGLKIVVSDLRGTVERRNEVGICYATGLAIARSLSKDDSSLMASMADWSVEN